VDGFLAAEKIRRIPIATQENNSHGQDTDNLNHFSLLSSCFIPYEYKNQTYVVSQSKDYKEGDDTFDEIKPEIHNLHHSYNHQCARLYHRQPTIHVNDRGQVIAVAFNNRSASAFDFPSDVAKEHSIMPEFYKAYRKFAEVIFDDKMQFNLKLKPGQAMIFNNRRVLHARTSFSFDENETSEESGSSPRHFQGCYSDKDAILSKYWLIKEELETDLH
jgi:alpha-ketoglutarate-dependent taurine dioxygenase